MPVWVGLGFVLRWNWRRHMADRSTLCSSAREHIPPAAFITAWAALTSWLIPHYCTRDIREALAALGRAAIALARVTARRKPQPRRKEHP